MLPPDQSPVFCLLHLIYHQIYIYKGIYRYYAKMTDILRAHNHGSLFRSNVFTAISQNPSRSHSPQLNTWGPSINRLTVKANLTHRHTHTQTLGATNQLGGIWTSQLLYTWCFKDYLSWFMWRCHAVGGWSGSVAGCYGWRCSIITTGGEDSVASSGPGTRHLRGLEIEGVPPTCCRGQPDEVSGSHICITAILSCLYSMCNWCCQKL